MSVDDAVQQLIAAAVAPLEAQLADHEARILELEASPEPGPGPDPGPIPGPDPGPIPGYPPETTLANPAKPTFALPPYRQEVTDPVFGGRITRITNTDGWRNTYSKVQPWNADGTRIGLFGYGNRLLDGNTYVDLGALSNIPGRATWSNVDPDLIWGSNNGDNRLKRYKPSNGTLTYKTFSGYTEVDLGNAEGNLSDDDRYIGLVAYPSAGGRQAMLYDSVADKVLFTASLPAEPDWLAVSHSGRYLVACYGADGSGAAQGYKVYDRQATNPGTPRHLYDNTTHSDFAFAPDGTELLVNLHGGVRAIRLSDGVSSVILAGSAFVNGHVSGRALKRPGWVYLSNHTYSPTNPGHDQIAALKTDGSAVNVWCHARTWQAAYQYDRSTHAVPSRDGTRVMWGGRWNDAGSMYSYVVRAA